MVDLHRHDEFSLFDGFGKASELAKLAKELGHTSLGTSNHGNTNGLVKTYHACKEVGIKPILGVEAYHKPKANEERKSFHLCLFAKNLQGYNNINRMLFEAEKNKYYQPLVFNETLKKHSNGVICTSACVAGYISQALLKGNNSAAAKMVSLLKSYFGDDFYIEIQPYKLDQDGTQERINKLLIELADEYDVKCILTSDSHRGRQDELETYIKMHEMAGHNTYDIEQTYGERYMPTEKQLVQRFVAMHEEDFGHKKALKMAKQMIKNLEEIEDKVEEDIFSSLSMTLPTFENGTDQTSFELLKQKVKEGLKLRGKAKNKKYIERCKKELDVIRHLGFEDYFLMVADYVQWAKDRGIMVGPGRGSGCNSQVCWALRITEVDSLRYHLDFRRFLRKDKKKMPDIDLDFETKRRDEVIEYLVNKYKGHSAQICSYGNYKVDNLLNDLAKVCGLKTDKSMDQDEAKENKKIIADLKALVKKCIDVEEEDVEPVLKRKGIERQDWEVNSNLNISYLKTFPQYKEYNKKYDNILKHFCSLYMKVRFIGTHAAGVAITGDDIFNFTTLRVRDGKIFASYDLDDLDKIKVTKFDILGLRTMEEIGVLRRLTGNDFDDDITEDKKILEMFKNAETDGIFQFESNTAKSILSNIECDCFEDVIATNAMNRPGPLSLGMPEMYAKNKKEGHVQDSPYLQFTKETYGTIIYQEQIQKICVKMANMSWNDADSVMKMMKSNVGSREARRIEQESGVLRKKFLQGAKENGINVKEASDTYDKLLTYSFNKGHGAGYSLISVEEMFYKVYYQTEFWFAKLKFAQDESEVRLFASLAVKSGAVVFLPHVNYSADYSLRKFEGEKVIQQGLSSIKGVGEKAAKAIEEERKKNGPFLSKEDFVERCKGRSVHSGVISTLEEQGALEFNKKIYLRRVVKYNSTLLAQLERRKK